MLAAIDLPEDSPEELIQCFIRIKEYKTALPNPVDNLSVVKYEQYTMCLPHRICALLLPCHHPVPPGREKFMMEGEKVALSEMYMVLRMLTMYHFATHSFFKFKLFNKCDPL